MFNHPNEAANKLLNYENSTKTDFFLISKEYTIENSTSFYGCFNIGPFEAGEGLTIRNSLRRTLLTCVGGLAITAVEIEGVSHEYSSIPGLKETVLDLLLSMNDIVFTTQKMPEGSPIGGKLSSRTSSVSPTARAPSGQRVRSSSGDLLAESMSLPFGGESLESVELLKTLRGNVDNARGTSHSYPWPSQIGYLKKSGPGIIYAHDLRLPPGICCVNPKHILGTLSDTGHLNMKFEMQFGKNWKETKSQLGIDKKWLRTEKAVGSSFGRKGHLSEATYRGQSEHSMNTIIPEEKTLINNQIVLNPVFNPIKKVNYTIESLNDSSFFTTGLFQQILTGESFPFGTSLPLCPEEALAAGGGRSPTNLALGKPINGALGGRPTQPSPGCTERENNPLTSLYSNTIQNFTTKNQLELIVLEIWTDGSIHPRDALRIALRKCITTFSKLGEIPCQ
jgi:DNA-directed RNA polymerase alpha subunit